MKKKNWIRRYKLSLAYLCLFFAVFSSTAQAQARSVEELYNETENYVKEKIRELISSGKKVDADKRESLGKDQKNLAKKTAAEISVRTDLKGTDLYYLGLLFDVAENEAKTLETMKRLIAQYPPGIKGDAIQSARSFIIIISAKQKQFAEAEQTLEAWLKGDPQYPKKRPALEKSLAVSFYKDGKYDEATKYAQSAFDLLKGLEAKTLAERRSKMVLYGDLVEVLAMSYRKNKKVDDGLNVLAEGRALSFTIPSATLYRRVMEIVGGSGFSEKKLMQKVESYRNADPIPEPAIQEWLGQNPTTLESLRGNVVLLDFWATWCGPCISTFPRLRDWHKKYSSEGLTIIGVTQFYGKVEDKQLTPLQELDYLAEFKKKHKLPYAFAISRAGDANVKYDINAYPTTILLDRNGVVRYIGIGASAEESENLNDMIKKVLAEDSRLAVTRD